MFSFGKTREEKMKEEYNRQLKELEHERELKHQRYLKFVDECQDKINAIKNLKIIDFIYARNITFYIGKGGKFIGIEYSNPGDQIQQVVECDEEIDFNSQVAYIKLKDSDYYIKVETSKPEETDYEDGVCYTISPFTWSHEKSFKNKLIQIQSCGGTSLNESILNRSADEIDLNVKKFSALNKEYVDNNCDSYYYKEFEKSEEISKNKCFYKED